MTWRGAALARESRPRSLVSWRVPPKAGCSRRLPRITRRSAALSPGIKIIRNASREFITLGGSREPPAASFSRRI
jgi:hypothetical protein